MVVATGAELVLLDEPLAGLTGQERHETLQYCGASGSKG